MSTLLYAQLTTKRDSASPGESLSKSPPGLQTYVDALAALVPSEALALHAAIIAVTTKVKDGITTIESPMPLEWAFFALIVLSGCVYTFARLSAKAWDQWDWLRVFIAPSAFVGWMMLQRVTAFDAVAPNLDGAARSVIALLLAVVLGLAANALAYKADQKQP